jgi:hypothetical protein
MIRANLSSNCCKRRKSCDRFGSGSAASRQLMRSKGSADATISRSALHAGLTISWPVLMREQGKGVHISVNAPYWLRNGDSISITASFKCQFMIIFRALYHANYFIRKIWSQAAPPVPLVRRRCNQAVARGSRLQGPSALRRGQSRRTEGVRETATAAGFARPFWLMP